MNITLTKELEHVVEEKIKSGLYPNASAVVGDAIRRAFCQPLDIEQDTPELAAMLREAMNGPHTPYEKGDLRRLLEKVRREVGK